MWDGQREGQVSDASSGYWAEIKPLGQSGVLWVSPMIHTQSDHRTGQWVCCYFSISQPLLGGVQVGGLYPFSLDQLVSSQTCFVWHGVYIPVFPMVQVYFDMFLGDALSLSGISHSSVCALWSAIGRDLGLHKQQGIPPMWLPSQWSQMLLIK